MTFQTGSKVKYGLYRSIELSSWVGLESPTYRNIGVY